LRNLSKSDRELYEEAGEFLKKQDYRRCLRLLEEINDQTKPFILNAFGIVFHLLQERNNAEAYYLKAIGKSHIDALFNIANLYRKQRKHEEAEAYYLKAIEKGDVNALNDLATVYCNQKKYEEAEAYYLKAI
jgi:TPR repeat protein